MNESEEDKVFLRIQEVFFVFCDLGRPKGACMGLCLDEELLRQIQNKW